MRGCLFVIAALCSILAVGCQSTPQLGPETPSITTIGTATVYAMPDRATITISLNNVDKLVASAHSANEADAVKFIKIVKDAGVKASDIAVGGEDVTLHYQDSEDPVSHRQTSERDGYEASRSYIVTFNDLTLAPKVYLAICESGLNARPSLQVEIAETRKYKDKAREMALLAAREKAEAMAKVLGLKVGKARIIEERQSGGYYYSNNNNNNNSNSGGDQSESSPDTDETFPIGAEPVQASVLVKFDLQ